MKGYKLNDDQEQVARILKGLSKKEGHCPCRIQKDDSTLCPCDDFVQNKVCKCNLFVPIPKVS